MTDKIKLYLEVTNYLGDERNKSILEGLLSRRQKQVFYLPVIGQFSAGKSKLINTLLEQPLLPTKATETTALVTSIMYGSNQVILEKHDGSLIEYPFDELKTLHQDATDCVKQGKHIHVQMEHKLLKTGMTFIDTPGLNTVINSHEAFTYEMLPYADYAIYVIGRGISAADCDVIAYLLKLGIDLSFVRTKIDTIQDEPIETVIEADRTLLRSILTTGVEPRYFAVSTDVPDLVPANQGMSLAGLRQYLQEELADQAGRQASDATERRLAVIGSELQRTLVKRQQEIQNLEQCELSELEGQLVALRQEQRVFDQEKSRLAVGVFNQVRRAEVAVRQEVKAAVDESVADYKIALDTCASTEEMHKKAPTFANMSTNEFLEKVRSVLAEETQALITAARSDYSNIARKIETDLRDQLGQHIFQIDVIEPDFTEMNDYAERRLAEVADKVEAVRAAALHQDEEIRRLGLAREEIAASLFELAALEQEVKNNLTEHGSYVPTLIHDPGSNTCKNVFGRIGSLLDIALIFAPIPAGKAKAGAQAAKALKGATKVAEIAKVAKVAQKCARYLHEVRQNDALPEQIKETGILDYLTLEYLLSKAGEQLDRKPYTYVDVNEEQAYFQKKEKLESEYAAAIRTRLAREENVGLISDKLAKIEREKQLKSEYADQMAASLERELRELKIEGQRLARERYSKELCYDAEVQYSQYSARLFQQYSQYLAKISSDIIIYHTAEIEKQLQRKTESIAFLLEQRNSIEDRLAVEKQQIDQYLTVVADREQ